jgi:hypothetical protein
MESKLYIVVLWYLKKSYAASDGETALFKVRRDGENRVNCIK